MRDASIVERVRLAATLAPLGDWGAGLAFISESGFEAVQLSASQRGLRPRELDGSARRALREQLRRLELTVAGIDLWIPQEHFTDPAHVSRAVDAFGESLSLAEFLDRTPLSCVLPDSSSAAAVRATLLSEADRRGVTVADFGEHAVLEGPVRRGIDLAALRARNGSLIEAMALAGAQVAAIRIPTSASGAAGETSQRREAGEDSIRELQVLLHTGGFAGIPVVDARQASEPRAALLSLRDAWRHAAAVG